MGSGTTPMRVLAGRYRLQAVLGAGGMGRVWQAHDARLGVDVAVKEVFRRPGIQDAAWEELLVRAQREARHGARLRDHPNIVTVFDVVVEDGIPWTVMRLVEGVSLEARLAHGPLSVGETRKIAVAILDALAAAHHAGIVHRDVKPANILLADDGGILLTDFGIAINEADTKLTQDGSVIGSMAYIAPERADGEQGDAASDLFSLGATLYQATEGVSPFQRNTLTGTLRAVAAHEPPPPTHAGQLAPLITALLHKEPSRRPTVAKALAMTRTTTTTTPRPAPATPPAATAAKAGGTPSAAGAREPGFWPDFWARAGGGLFFLLAGAGMTLAVVLTAPDAGRPAQNAFGVLALSAMFGGWGSTGLVIIARAFRSRTKEALNRGPQAAEVVTGVVLGILWTACLMVYCAGQYTLT